MWTQISHPWAPDSSCACLKAKRSTGATLHAKSWRMAPAPKFVGIEGMRLYHGDDGDETSLMPYVSGQPVIDI